MPHAVLSDFHTELINRASGFQVQFSFDAEVGRKSQTLEDATRQALVLAYFEAFPKDRSTTYKLAKKHLGLNRGQVVQRAADARKGTNKRSEIDNLRRWAEQRISSRSVFSYVVKLHGNAGRDHWTGWQHSDKKRLQSKAAKCKSVPLFSRHYPTELLR